MPNALPPFYHSLEGGWVGGTGKYKYSGCFLGLSISENSTGFRPVSNTVKPVPACLILFPIRSTMSVRFRFRGCLCQWQTTKGPIVTVAHTDGTPKKKKKKEFLHMTNNPTQRKQNCSNIYSKKQDNKNCIIL